MFSRILSWFGLEVVRRRTLAEQKLLDACAKWNEAVAYDPVCSTDADGKIIFTDKKSGITTDTNGNVVATAIESAPLAAIVADDPDPNEDPPPFAVPMIPSSPKRIDKASVVQQLQRFRGGQLQPGELAQWLLEQGDEERAAAIMRLGRFDCGTSTNGKSIRELKGRHLDIKELQQATREDNVHSVLVLFPEVYHAPSMQFRTEDPVQKGRFRLPKV